MITKTEHRLCSAYHPQVFILMLFHYENYYLLCSKTYGLTEPFNQTLSRCSSKMADQDKKNWDLKIETVLMSYMASRQASKKYSQHILLFQKVMRLPNDNEIVANEESHVHMENDLEISVEAVLRIWRNVLKPLVLHIANPSKQKESYD